MCQTIHKINTLTGLTLFVNKRCALPSECSMEMVGCHNTNRPGIQLCISCCNYDDCNQPSSSSSQKVVIQHSTFTSYSTSTSFSIMYYRVEIVNWLLLLLLCMFSVRQI
ncbi:hypothetical protein LSH36_163g04025 [Paralvinella palmiformis]|uniref:Uncharacterized protein n=1 Tax=Paralvinella palmiformis TaxID=53620 RepID=A0AAD9N812_9ANNE|nr:hypothetical protein LSH36_163g04025 [Paralvinella palmiformis]